MRKILLSIGATVSVPIGAYLFATSYTIYQPLAFNQVRLTQAAEWVQTHKKFSYEGAVLLPPSLASVSVTGKAYVNENIIFFPSLVGRRTLLPDMLNTDADWVEGYGYSDEVLPTEESKPAGSDKFFCMVNMSDPPQHVPSFERGDNGRQMAIDSQIAAQWYKVDAFS